MEFEDEELAGKENHKQIVKFSRTLICEIPTLEMKYLMEITTVTAERNSKCTRDYVSRHELWEFYSWLENYEMLKWNFAETISTFLLREVRCPALALKIQSISTFIILAERKAQTWSCNIDDISIIVKAVLEFIPLNDRATLIRNNLDICAHKRRPW